MAARQRRSARMAISWTRWGCWGQQTRIIPALWSRRPGQHSNHDHTDERCPSDVEVVVDDGDAEDEPAGLPRDPERAVAGSELADPGDDHLNQLPRHAVSLEQVSRVESTTSAAPSAWLMIALACRSVSRPLATWPTNSGLTTRAVLEGMTTWPPMIRRPIQTDGWWRPRSDAIGTIAVSIVSRWKAFAGVAPKRHHSMGRVLRPITRVTPMAAVTISAGSESPQTMIQNQAAEDHAGDLCCGPTAAPTVHDFTPDAATGSAGSRESLVSSLASIWPAHSSVISAMLRRTAISARTASAACCSAELTASSRSSIAVRIATARSASRRSCSRRSLRWAETASVTRRRASCWNPA